ncbi:fructosamine-3-kinase [Alkalibacillus flavidus]|uniref:Fructosamine-3-kinase n=1 Tax=Alkalibacillus flavidus TaxID=546021 RepID=A0ABV2KSL2_9BACI
MPEHIKRIVEKATSTIVDSVVPVSGGDINDSFDVKTSDGRFFVKTNREGPESFFEREVEGLKRIASTHTVHVPEVIDFSDENHPSYLILEWVQPKRGFDEAILGQKIAQLHHHTHSQYGFSDFTYVGTLKQPNGLYDNWAKYYRDQRLRNQMTIGESLGVMKGQRANKLNQLLDQIERIVPKDPPPSYLHGDLWNGNWMFDQEGKPYVIDPSFLYGDRYFELAFADLFGGFSSSFYDGYRSVLSIGSDYEELKPLYQLFFLLVHLNIFGEAYGKSVDRILHYYV